LASHGSDRTLLPGEDLAEQARIVHIGFDHNLLRFVRAQPDFHEDVIETKERVALLSEHTGSGALALHL
jgi:hypothetical protein